MNHFKYVILFCVAVINSALFAQSQKELGQLMRNRNEYYFTLSVNDPAEIQTINGICSVDGADGHTVVCYANQQQYDKLLQAGYQPDLQTPPSLREEAVMWDGNRATYDWNSYLTYEQYVSMMEGFPNSVTNNANCTLLDLGTLSTSNHRKILGVRLNNGQPNGKPKFLYTSTMHGDEVTGMILMLRLIDEFCTSNDSRIANILDNVDLFIFPCTNPDGTYYGGNSSVSGARRNNGNGYDLNRHFPDFDDGAHPDGASSYQDEAQWMMDLAQEYLFTMAANYHGGSELLNYPWDTYQPLHPDDDWWKYVSREYANLAQSVSSSYMTDQNNGITNGYAWYTITGSRQDYMNYYGQCREVTIECSTDKTPSASQLPNFWNYNHIAMLTYIEECLNGIHGVVRDANTNEPIIGATITVQNHDALGSSVTSHAIGDFHRPIKGGNWTLKITKDGYCAETVDVTVSDGQRVDLDVYLTPVGSCQVAMDCYEQVTPSTGGSYVMGYLNESTLVMPTHNNSSSVTTTSVPVTITANGFSMEEETLPGSYTLTAYGNGQYYISYNGRYLARSSFGSSLTWGTSTSSYGRWHIDANGIYVSASGSGGGPGGGSSSNYYLYYDNGSFRLSTTQQNNITFYVAGDCQTSTFTINATVNPIEGGTVEGAGTYNQGVTCTLAATANEGYTFINWTENDEEVSTDANYSFVVTADRELVANFELISTPTYEIVLSANPTEGGEVSGAGTFEEGAIVTVTATAAGGYNFINWTENGEEVSTNAAYTFEVTGNRELVANFEEIINTAEQTITLPVNWSWWSTYLDIDLAQLKEALGTAGTSITSQFDGFTGNYSGTWLGGLQSISPSKMYMLDLNEEITITLSGVPVNPADYPITLDHGTNWIGYPVSQSMSIGEAFASANPENGDSVSSRTESAMYYEGTWYGNLQMLEPGKGYIYTSNATESKTFIFQSAK